MSIIFEYLGLPLTHQKIVPGNTITGLGSEFRNYTERYIAFTSGGTTATAVGDWIVGATSAAKAKVLAVTITSGTFAAGTAAGYLIVNSQHGTFQSENIKIAAGTDDATIASNTRLCIKDEYINKEFYTKDAKACLVSVYAQTALTAWDGGKPDQTALVGQPMAAATSIILRDPKQISNFRCIDYTAASASTLQLTFYF